MSLSPLEQGYCMMSQPANPSEKRSVCFLSIDSSALRSTFQVQYRPVCAIVRCRRLQPTDSWYARKNKEISSRRKVMADDVPLQVGRVYVRNSRDGLCYRFPSVRLGSFQQHRPRQWQCKWSRLHSSHSGPRDWSKTWKVSLITERRREPRQCETKAS